MNNKKQKRIVIFSRSPESHFNRRIIQEAGNFNIDAVLINPTDCFFHQNKVFYKDQPLEEVDLCILRTPPFREEKDYFHIAANIMESSGYQVINTSSAVEISGNKFKTSMVLSKAGIPILPSVAVRKVEHLKQAVKHVGGFPVMLKTIFGTRGIGVIFCPCFETLRAAAETMWAYYANTFVEKYAAKSKGSTVRVLICNDEVLGAVRNVSSSEPSNVLISENQEFDDLQEIRSNFSRGGDILPFELTGEMKAIAQTSAKTLGLKLAGVDLIEDNTGWKILEINSSPGIKGFEQATGENIAGKIISNLL
jgi:ribosomal protein S6--L-glutamate ligase